MSWVSPPGLLLAQSTSLFPGLWQHWERKRGRKEKNQTGVWLSPTTNPSLLRDIIPRDQHDYISHMYLPKPNYQLLVGLLVFFFKQSLLLFIILMKIIHGIFCPAFSACGSDLAELLAEGAGLNAGKGYEWWAVIYCQWQEGDTGHGVAFKAWIRVLWQNEGALGWLNY